MSSALTAAFATSIGLSSPAHALEAKQCLPMAEMNAALKAEGQRTLIIGDRIAALSNGAGGTNMLRRVNTVTSDADGSRGYQLEGDHSRTEQSTQVCVRAKLTDVQLFDARRTSIPRAAYLGGDFDRVVDESAAGGSRPMVVANTVFGSGPSQHNGSPLVVFGNIPAKAGLIATFTPDGKSHALALMGNTEYTSVALEKLGNRTLAALAP